MSHTAGANMLSRRQSLCWLGALPSLGAPAWAQPLPSAAPSAADSRLLRVVVPFAPGNLIDTALRQVAEVFRVSGGDKLLIDNRPGGLGGIAAQQVAQSAADGRTLLLSTPGILSINPHTVRKLPYDSEKSFRSVTMLLSSSMVLAVSSKVPARQLSEFASWVCAHPRDATYASFTAGNTSHFAGVILNQRLGLNLVHVPYNGTPQAVQNLIGGQVDAAFLPLLAVLPHLASGRLRVLAVTRPNRSPLLPEAPTFRELGYPELEMGIWAGLSAPAATPDATVSQLNASFVSALNSPQLRERWASLDLTPIPGTPEDMNRFLKAESSRWKAAVLASGFTHEP
jgi:tripartite-type tricarboxylate transporter receptor subunit TctC